MASRCGRDLIRDWYTDEPPCGDLRATKMACAYRAHGCKETAIPTTSYTRRRITPRPWPTRCIWGLGWVPCARLSLRVSTPSFKCAYNDHTGRASNGQVRARHLAPAAPAPRPSVHSQLHMCAPHESIIPFGSYHVLPALLVRARDKATWWRFSAGSHRSSHGPEGGP